MKKLPVGIQTFSELIENEYLYVDKTRHIHGLFADGGKYYFLSRPRRFGKSLLISTLSELFSGNKELFKDLWIYDKTEWPAHPVIHIDFTNIEYENSELLKQSLVETLDAIAADHGLQLTSVSYKTRFGELIKKMSGGETGKVVILVDEYDKPITDQIEKKETAEANRNILANFYGVIKGTDKYLKFVFLTGVSKFSKVSVFSGLNNLRDITLSEEFSTLLGYTQDELPRYFDAHISNLAEKMGEEKNRLLDKIKEWYNGYSWDGNNFVYNPFSILNLFNEKSFDNYWFSTGTPTFLLKLIKQQPYVLPELEQWPVSSYAFDSYDIAHVDIVPLLFQTGYLTIKQITIKEDTNRYRLDYPNREVRDSFLVYLLQEFTRRNKMFGIQIRDRINGALEKDDIAGFFEEMKTLFASIPYQIFIGKKEAYYHTVVYLVLKLAGAQISAEDSTNIGRMDAVLETGKKIYIMEFKMGSEHDALNQVKEKKYHEKYRGRGKDIVLVGIGFDEEKKNIAGYVLESA